MKKVIVFCIITFVVFLISLGGKRVLASSDVNYLNYNSDEILGLYAVTRSVNSKKKIFIDRSIVSFVKSTRREVYYENYEYYYYASQYVDEIVSIRAISSDIDSVIFMINELETEAKARTSDVIKQKNMCLGYLRSIKESYADNGSNYGSKWGILAGSTDENFVKEVNANYSHGLRLNEFFSQFINYNEYNISLHGELDYKYQRSQDKNPALYLIDPQGKKKIDLIHMFASMDGIFYKTGALITFGNKMQRDVLSWNGDLQTAVKELKYSNHNLDFKKSNFYDIMNANIGCSEDDILADIDAMNVVKGYIDNDNNSLADSLIAYYEIIKTYPFRRYTMFMYTATIDIEYFDRSDDAFKTLKEEIYHQFDLKEMPDGSIVDFSYKGLYFEGYMIMTEDMKSMPSKEIREFVTKNFISYLKRNIVQAEC